MTISVKQFENDVATRANVGHGVLSDNDRAAIKAEYAELKQAASSSPGQIGRLPNYMPDYNPSFEELNLAGARSWLAESYPDVYRLLEGKTPQQEKDEFYKNARAVLNLK